MPLWQLLVLVGAMHEIRTTQYLVAGRKLEAAAALAGALLLYLFAGLLGTGVI